jgi:hypothetical protein
VLPIWFLGRVFVTEVYFGSLVCFFGVPNWKLIISGRNKGKKCLRECEKEIVNIKKLIFWRPDWI